MLLLKYFIKKSYNSFQKLYKIHTTQSTYICVKSFCKMEKVVLKTDLSCKHCVMKVEPVLKSQAGIIDYSVDLENPDKLVTINSEGANINSVIEGFEKAGYKAEKV